MLRFSAYRVYLMLSAAMTLAQAVMYTTLAVYYVQTVGMNPLQLVLVGTVLEGTILVCEIPTGVVADTYSRRLSVILGFFILAVSWTLEGWLPFFGAIIAAEIVRGFGETFLSGALDAWLADEVGEEQVGAVYLRSGQINRVAGLLGALLSVGLASIALRLPVLFGGGVFLLLAVFLALTMPEQGFTPAPRGERTTWRHMGHTFITGARVVRRSQTLTLLLIIGVFAGVASEGFDRLWEARLLQFPFPRLGQLEPVVWFGIINVANGIVGLIVTELFRRRLEVASRQASRTARVLLVLNAMSIVSIIGFGLAGNFGLAVAALMVKGVIGGLAGPLYQAWLIQNIDPRVRATALSMISQTDALGQTLGGPAVGAIGLRSLRAAMVAAGVLLSPGLLIFLRTIRRGTDQERTPELAPVVEG